MSDGEKECCRHPSELKVKIRSGGTETVANGRERESRGFEMWYRERVDRDNRDNRD
jgi:hypothetical protein